MVCVTRGFGGGRRARCSLSTPSSIRPSTRAAPGAKQSYAAFSDFMDRFHIAGLRRVLTELASEALTLGIAAGLVALALAIPAFQETSDDWLKKQDLAVTFLDRYGAGGRPARHQAR